MPTFCRHGRFVERCPICSRALAETTAQAASPRARPSRRSAAQGQGERAKRSRPDGLRVVRQGRAADDGYRCELIPGIRSSEDAQRLAREIEFSAGRLLTLGAGGPGPYGAARGQEPDSACWTCLLIVYLSPLEGEDPFRGIELALSRGEDPDLSDVPLGPRTCHDPSRGGETLRAYRQWVERAGGGSAAAAFTGDEMWTAQRRFERLLERLALPGLPRMGRYDLLVTLGRLGIVPVAAGSLHLAGLGGLSPEDPTTLAAKRVFGIGDPLLLERRALALADAAAVPVEALDLALANWAAPARATMGMGDRGVDETALEIISGALGI